MHIAIFGMGSVNRAFRQWPERVLGERLVQLGHHVVAYGYHLPDAAYLRERAEEVGGIQVRRVHPRFWPARELHRTMAREIVPDVAHIFHPRNVLACSAVRLLRRWKVPIVYTWLGPFHDAFLVDDRESPYDEQPHYDRLIYTPGQLVRRIGQGGSIREHLRNYCLHWPLTQVDLHLPCSQHEAQVLARMGMPQERTRVVPLWIEAEELRSFPQRPPEQTFSRPIVLYIGQITHRKGPDLVVEAMPPVVERYPGASFVFVGYNPAGRAQLEVRAKALGVAQNLHFVGRVSEEEKVAFLRACDAYVLPTRYEGFGLPLLEAMACQAPLISSEIPVVNEIVQHGKNGLLIPRGDGPALAQAILRLVGDEPLRRRLIEGGERTLRERYDGAGLVQEVLAAYREAMEVRSKRARSKR